MDRVFLTRRISDTTEGRGPMLPDLCFRHREDAEKYIDDKPGVMGRFKRWSQEKHGDWDIMELQVFDSCVSAEEAEEYKAKKLALAKLTRTEKELLGLI